MNGRTSLAHLAWPALLLVGACASPSTAPDAADDIVLARIDEQPLTLRDALDTFLTSHASHGALVRGEPAVRELAGRIIERRLFLAEAGVLGVDRDPDLDGIVDDYAMELGEIAFWRREVDDKIHVPDEDVEAFYAKTEVALDITLVVAGTREQAEALHERALAGADLGELARTGSTHPSRDFDGKLGFVRRGELDKALEAPLFALEDVGSMTPVVETRDGFAFARLDQRTVNLERPARQTAIPQIREILKSREEDRLRAEVEQRLRAEAGVAVDATLLDRDTLLGSDRGDAVVARSAGETLTLGDFRDLLNLDAVRAADPETMAAAARDLADSWAWRRALRRGVRESGVLQVPELARKAEVFREDAILKMLYDRYVYADVEVSEEDVRAWYDEYRDTEFTRPAEVELGCILLPDEEQARATLQRLQDGEDFAALARELSRDPGSAGRGGRVGWVRPGSVLPEVEERAFALEPHTIDGPISTQVGFYLITVLDRRDPQLVPYAVAHDAAERQVVKARQKQAYLTWVERLRARATTEVDGEGIREAVAWLDAEAEREAAADAAEKAARPPAPPGHGPEGPVLAPPQHASGV